MARADRLDTDIHTFLDRHAKKQLLRFVTVGSVDDGKSTLIGRLLHDTGGVFEDQLADARTGAGDGEIDFARITDGLEAEREQGITIDVAYRYFTTANRKYIIADTPGHVQYTRNMATGASTADVAIILIDARLGVLQQSRRHAYIASLLGIPHLLVAINKMDLVDYDEATYESIKKDFQGVTESLRFHDVTFIPVSALLGENVVERGDTMAWYDGPGVLQFLETVEVGSGRNMEDFRYPVQYVLRPNLDYRGFSGEVVSGVVKKGDPITVLPSGHTSRVKAIDTYDGELDEAFAPQSVTIRLEDEVDVSRGDMLVKTGAEPTTLRTFDAHVVWMSETPLDPAKQYLIKHTTRYVRCNVDTVQWKLDLETMTEESSDSLALNDIGRLTLTAHRPIYCDAYADNRSTGAFVVIDSFSNDTVGAGMIVGAGEGGDTSARSGVSPLERRRRLGHAGAALVIERTDELGDALAFALERRLFDLGMLALAVQDVADLPSAAKALTDAGALAIVQGVPGAVEGLGSKLGTALVVDVPVDGLTMDTLDDAVATAVTALRQAALVD